MPATQSSQPTDSGVEDRRGLWQPCPVIPLCMWGWEEGPEVLDSVCYFCPFIQLWGACSVPACVHVCSCDQLFVTP